MNTNPRVNNPLKIEDHTITWNYFDGDRCIAPRRPRAEIDKFHNNHEIEAIGGG